MLNRFLTKDFVAGVMFVGFGGLAYVVAFTDLSKFAGQSRLALGTPVRMGPGYVPQMLAFVMMGLGVVIALWAIRGHIVLGILKLIHLFASKSDRPAGAPADSTTRRMDSARAVIASGEPIEGGHWKPIGMITLGVLAFGILLDPANIPGMVSWFVPGLPRWENPVSGLLPATIAMIFLAAAGSKEFKWRETAAMCVVLFVFCYAIFIWGLSMNIAILTGVW